LHQHCIPSRVLKAADHEHRSRRQTLQTSIAQHVPAAGLACPGIAEYRVNRSKRAGHASARCSGLTADVSSADSSTCACCVVITPGLLLLRKKSEDQN
jgi:hypothetical protein